MSRLASQIVHSPTNVECLQRHFRLLDAFSTILGDFFSGRQDSELTRVLRGPRLSGESRRQIPTVTDCLQWPTPTGTKDSLTILLFRDALPSQVVVLMHGTIWDVPMLSVPCVNLISYEHTIQPLPNNISDFYNRQCAFGSAILDF